MPSARVVVPTKRRRCSWAIRSGSIGIFAGKSEWAVLFHPALKTSSSPRRGNSRQPERSGSILCALYGTGEALGMGLLGNELAWLGYARPEWLIWSIDRKRSHRTGAVRGKRPWCLLIVLRMFLRYLSQSSLLIVILHLLQDPLLLHSMQCV